jgi:hypothetical protein
MPLSDRLLVACSRCHAWPMAVAGPPVRWQNPSEMISAVPAVAIKRPSTSARG